MQGSLQSYVTFQGVGLHTGLRCRMTVHPAPAGHGIVFRRCDVTDHNPLVPARWDLVEPSPLCTRLTNAEGVGVSTVEHIMAALAGCGIHNARVDLTGPEVPIMDGSASVFVSAFLGVGIVLLDAPVHALRLRRSVTVRRDGAIAALHPNPVLRIDFDIDFQDPAIGVQSKSLEMSNGAFVRELSRSRTFCRQSDIGRMQANGLALGGCPGENAVVFDGPFIMSPGGLRHSDEPVRHKMLDAFGDLALAGLPILGHYKGSCAGHALTNALLQAMFDDPGCYDIITCNPQEISVLPGAGVGLDTLPLSA